MAVKRGNKPGVAGNENMNALPETDTLALLLGGEEQAQPEQVVESYMGAEEISVPVVEEKVEAVITPIVEQNSSPIPGFGPAEIITENKITGGEQKMNLNTAIQTIKIGDDRAIDLGNLAAAIKMKLAVNCNVDFTNEIDMITGLINSKIANDPQRVATGNAILKELTLNGFMPYVVKVILNRAEFTKAASQGVDPAGVVGDNEMIDEGSIKKALAGFLPVDAFKKAVLVFSVCGDTIEVFIAVTQTLIEIVAAPGDTFGPLPDSYGITVGFIIGLTPQTSYIRVIKTLNRWKGR